VASSTRDALRPPASVSATAVSVRSITRVFGITPAVVRVDLDVDPGEVLLVRGPNGAGKTTLLRILATAISPTYGGGTVLGHDLHRGRAAIRAGTELVGHRTRLYDDLTAEENLRFTARLHGIHPHGVAGSLGRVGLAGAARERVRTFSAGMRQRVALARAMLRSPPLLLLDDPYAALDGSGREVVDAEIARARSEGRTVVLTSHEPAAEALATRVAWLRDGRITEATG
jgi:heme exporter protein A